MKTIIKITLLLLMVSQLTFGYSFTYTGPSILTVGFGGGTAGASFGFTYYDSEGIIWPRLAILIDGDLVSGAVDNRSTPSSYTMSLTPGEHTIGFYLYELGESYDDPEILHQSEETVVKVKVTVKIQNNFVGGFINVGNTIPKVSPKLIPTYQNYNFNIGAIDQPYGGYDHIWNTNGTNNSDWTNDKGNGSEFYSNSRNTTYTVANLNTSTVVQANLKKVCNVTFSNDFQATSNGGTITVDGSSDNAPIISSVVEGSTITATAVSSYTVDEITHKFWYWDNDMSDNSKTKTFSISEHKEHVAHYKPSIVWVSSLDLTLNSYNPKNQQNIQLSWNEHPSSGIVEYIVRRGINHEAVTTIATVNRGTTTYTDADFYLAADGTEETVKYNVTCQFSPYDTTGITGFIYTDGEDARVNKLAEPDSILVDLPSIQDYALNSNYPNPFNPTTQISYQIPQNSFVNLIVYNSIGQRVAELVNQHQSSGRYSVQFNAANLPSGVYIYKLQTNNFSDVKKMLLTK
jgi:Secretion system C-terminal sorting domain